MEKLVYLVSGGVSSINADQADPQALVEDAYTNALASLEMNMDTAVPIVDGTIVSFIPPVPDHTIQVMDHIGLASAPHIRVDEDAGVAGVCFHEAVKQIVSGQMDIVIACGWRTAHEQSSAHTRRTHEPSDHLTQDQLAKIYFKNWRNAGHNPYAPDRMIDIGKGEMVSSSQMTIDHARRAYANASFPNAAIPNAAAVCILASSEGRRKIQARGRLRHPVIVSAVGYAHTDDPEQTHSLTKLAVTQAYERNHTHIRRPFYELDFLELSHHDPLHEIAAYEDFGLCSQDQFGNFIDYGFPFMSTVDYGAKVRPYPKMRSIAINPSGGLMACGDAGAATNLRQVVFSFWQIQNSIKMHFGSPVLQVPHARRCAVHGTTKDGNTVTVSILER